MAGALTCRSLADWRPTTDEESNDVMLSDDPYGRGGFGADGRWGAATATFCFASIPREGDCSFEATGSARCVKDVPTFRALASMKMDTPATTKIMAAAEIKIFVNSFMGLLLCRPAWACGSSFRASSIRLWVKFSDGVCDSLVDLTRRAMFFSNCVFVFFIFFAPL